jgi:hypothetical protein
MLRDVFLHASSELAPGQHHPSATSQAFQPNVGTQAGDLPEEATAGVWFSQTHVIVQVKIG